jgi:hypothetical protein
LAEVLVESKTLTTTHPSTIVLECAGKKYRKLRLVVSLTLVIESVPITVRDGRVAGVGVGRASSSASLGLATGPDRKPHELASKQLAQFVLPSWELKTPLTVG